MVLIMRTSMAVTFVALMAGLAGWNSGAGAQSVEAFLAGTTKDCPGCNLAGAKLKRRNLADADLSGANLAGASFHRSSVRGANLSGADLTDANLNKTDLLQANFSRANMKGAISHRRSWLLAQASPQTSVAKSPTGGIAEYASPGRYHYVEEPLAQPARTAFHRPRSRDRQTAD
jgi:Pentapeptide repeats (8 copies)